MLYKNNVMRCGFSSWICHFHRSVLVNSGQIISLSHHLTPHWVLLKQHAHTVTVTATKCQTEWTTEQECLCACAFCKCLCIITHKNILVFAQYECTNSTILQREEYKQRIRIHRRISNVPQRIFLINRTHYYVSVDGIFTTIFHGMCQSKFTLNCFRI